MPFRGLVFLACAAFLLAGLWHFLKPPPAAYVDVGTAAIEAHFTVQRGVVSGPESLSVRQGYPLRVIVESDTRDRVHLHGYELVAELQPGVPATLEFTANLAGRFELELHQAELLLGSLEVYPF